MKIVILNTSEQTGGAAIAANRLMNALRKNAIDATMLVRDKQTDSPYVASINNTWYLSVVNKFRFIYERLIIFISNRFSKKNLFSVSIANTGNNLSEHPLVKEADIIHLHWINQGFLSLENIEQLTKLNKPIVWTMHDMWPFTGICHHARECNNFQFTCKNCFYLKKPTEFDLSCKVFMRKKIVSHNNIHYVACSHWLQEQGKLAFLFSGKQIFSIPNPIDVTVFLPGRSKSATRKKMSIPTDKKLILFGAAKVSNERKGLNYMIDACSYLKKHVGLKDEIELVLFGKSDIALDTLFPFKIHYLSYLTRQEDIVDLYNAVDVFVIPSLEENLPNTIMESMACGTPCVGFDIGGIPEMIDHKENGYVAEYKNSRDLAAGICYILENANVDTLKVNCVEKVRRCYSEEIVANQYVQLYNSLLNSDRI